MSRYEMESTLEQTQKTASFRKTAIKTASFVCCPVTWGGLCLFCCSACCYDLCREGDWYEDFKRECFDRDQSRRRVCKYSTCEFEPEWQAASPPKNKCDLAQLVFNPCIFCCCCTRETEDTYLLPQEREDSRRAKLAIGILKDVQEVISGSNRIPQIPDLVLQGVGV